MSFTPELQAQLAKLKRQYFQQVDTSQLTWPEGRILKSSEVQSWIFDNLFNPDHANYAPPEPYQQRVLKVVISILERSIEDPEEDEISDELMSMLSMLYSSSLPSDSDAAQQKAYVTYAFPSHSASDNNLNDASVTLLESRAIISSAGTTGLRTWEAALLLGSYLTSASGQQLTHGKRIIELGAGTGMISILCARHLAVSGVVATDGDEAVVDAIKTNAFLNELDAGDAETPIRTAALKWGWPVHGSTFAEDYGMEVPDVVIGKRSSDVRSCSNSATGLHAGRIFQSEPGLTSVHSCDNTQRADVRDFCERV